MLRIEPFYETEYGVAYLGDAKEILADESLKNSVDLIMTSPPFALRRKKEYGNVEAGEYVAWFLEFARVFHRILKQKGSLVIHIGGSWDRGQPTRSLYHYELLIELCRMPGYKFYLAQEFFWYNPSKLPTPAEWVTVRRERVKDAVDCIWWLCKEPHPKASNRKVLQPYSESMEQLLKNGYKTKVRPSGHQISAKFSKRNNGAIPPNLIQIANTESNSRYLRACRQSGIRPHPARYPAGLPEFFIKMLTDEGDLVVDPFAGSNVTGEVCEHLKRRWVAVDVVEEYLEGSKFRFDEFCIGDWVERSGQRSFFLREETEKYQ
ncbi:MAG TPA: site-specific DNA-methyltransferase [Desulfotomaculum sp.]|nr:site-specific DNA-methyltransferase [Desulfotomaculum sp.]